jgi:predicted tellurium resistance membrane protein TerC
MFEWITNPEAWIALTTLIALEIVLGIDNIIFISILVGKLPEHQRGKGRTIGLGLAMVSRLVLLFSIVWVMGLVKPWFSVFDNDFSGRDIILIVGGLFLLGKSTLEIHDNLEVTTVEQSAPRAGKFLAVLLQITLLDVVFSLDSVITAVGLVQDVSIMVIAILISVGVMLFSAKPIGEFVDKNPTIKMLALSFLILIGFTLIGEGFEFHIPKGYVYFAMAFSVGVEILNIRIRKNRETANIHLSRRFKEESDHQDTKP